MKNKINLSVVLPVFNEEKNIPRVIKEFKKAAKNLTIEILFVEDGGSKDNTRKIIREQEKKHSFVKGVFTKEPGYGASILKGLQKAKGEYIGWTHADLQTPPKDTIKAYKIIQEQEEPEKTYAKGKRIGRPLGDKLINTIGMSLFETIILRTPLYDINAEPNIFHKSFLQHLNNAPKDFAFNLYSYYQAKRNNYTIKRFPVYFGKRIYGESAWNTGIKAKIKFIKRTIKFSSKLKKRLQQEQT